MEKIHMVDLQSQYLTIKDEIDRAIQVVLNSTAFIQGPQVTEFCNSLAKYLSADTVIGCANGTDALQIAMMALGYKPGDEIILPVHTYVATAEVIALLGLKPVFVDVNEDTFNIDISGIEKVITARTVAIVPVHLYGQCADMEPLQKLASAYGLSVIEDAAQSLSADYTLSTGETVKAGTMGTIGTTSFFPSKNLGCFGDGGAIITQNSELGERIKMIANHGQKVKYQHDLVGVNSRLDTIQAAVLSVKLQYLDEYTAKRRSVADFYDMKFGPIPGLKIPFRSKQATHVFHQYTLQVNNGKRNELKDYLAGHKIPSMIYYPIPLHMQKAYIQPGIGKNSFPVAEKLSASVISLPIHTELKEDQLEYIADKVINFFQ